MDTDRNIYDGFPLSYCASKISSSGAGFEFSVTTTCTDLFTVTRQEMINGVDLDFTNVDGFVDKIVIPIATNDTKYDLFQIAYTRTVLCQGQTCYGKSYCSIPHRNMTEVKCINDIVNGTQQQNPTLFDYKVVARPNEAFPNYTPNNNLHYYVDVPTSVISLISGSSDTPYKSGYLNSKY
eukprot:NODE_462_length_7167_cov_0.402518.p8 type:complete len:180 gc:universal NODE_462_length_7167_cov_0.402518:2135-1596(-)